MSLSQCSFDGGNILYVIYTDIICIIYSSFYHIDLMIQAISSRIVVNVNHETKRSPTSLTSIAHHHRHSKIEFRSGNMDSEGTTDLLSMISNIE